MLFDQDLLMVSMGVSCDFIDDYLTMLSVLASLRMQLIGAFTAQWEAMLVTALLEGTPAATSTPALTALIVVGGGNVATV